MAHARQQIREAAATTCTGLTTTGSTVYQSRVYPVETLPALSLYTLSEQVIERTMEGNELRELLLVIEGRVKATSNLDDTLDDIAEEVETALNADKTLSGAVKSLDLSETEIELSDDLEKPSGLIRLLFNVLRS